MQTTAYYVAMLTPLLWWPIIAAGVHVYWRTRSFPLLLVVLGSLVLGIAGLNSLLFRPDATFDAAGNASIYSVGLLPIEAHIITTAIGLSLIVVGIVILILRMKPPRVDT